MAESQPRMPVLPGNAQLPLVSFASSQVMLKGEVRPRDTPRAAASAAPAELRAF